MTALALESAVRSEVGPVRDNNEDAAYASPRLAAVADGVGGSAAGEVASHAAIDALVALDKRRLEGPLPAALRAAIADGNERIGLIAACRPRTAGMSTTLTAVALGDDGYAVANVGDSRADLPRGHVLRPLTPGDSLLPRLLGARPVTPPEARPH